MPEFDRLPYSPRKIGAPHAILFPIMRIGDTYSEVNGLRLPNYATNPSNFEVWLFKREKSIAMAYD